MKIHTELQKRYYHQVIEITVQSTVNQILFIFPVIVETKAPFLFAVLEVLLNGTAIDGTSLQIVIHLFDQNT